MPAQTPTSRPPDTAPAAAGAQSENVGLGVLYMLGAATIFAVMVGLLRLATEALHPFQAVFFRNAFGLAFMLPWLMHTGFHGLQTGQLRWHLLRACTGLLAMLGWFYAVALMPLAEAVSLSFSAPLFATVGAALILRERVRVRRWSATAIGFAGVLVIMRPGVEAISPIALVVLAAAAAAAASALLIKRLSRTESPAAIVTYMGLFLTPLSLVAAVPVWQWPSLPVLALMVAVAACGTGGHMLFARAMRHAEASALMPIDYLRLPLVAAIGFFAFGEMMDAWSWAGALVVVASAIYIARREAVVARRQQQDARVPLAGAAHREKY